MNRNKFSYDHIIWDWNGTLLDDQWLCIESINKLLSTRGLPILNKERYGTIFRFPVKDYYQEAGFDFTKESFEIPAMEFIQLYDKRKKECSLQSGALKVLEYFSKLGFQQYLLSASETGVLEEMTKHFGISHYFNIIKGLDNHYAHGKSELGKELLSMIEAPLGSIVMIGDTCHDKEVADLLNIDAILCTGGHFPENRLSVCGTRLIKELSELTEASSII
jgi:phosphoglycolate phosphatase